MITKMGLVKAISEYIDNTYNTPERGVTPGGPSWYSGLYIFNLSKNNSGDELITLKLIFKDLQHAKDITFCDETDFKQLKKAVDKLFEYTCRQCNICTNDMPTKYISCCECNNYYCLDCVKKIYEHSNKPLCPYCRHKI